MCDIIIALMDRYLKRPAITILALLIMWGLWSLSEFLGYHGLYGWATLLVVFFGFNIVFRIRKGYWIQGVD